MNLCNLLAKELEEGQLDLEGKACEIYLDWVNNFLSLQAFANYYGTDEQDANDFLHQVCKVREVIIAKTERNMKTFKISRPYANSIIYVGGHLLSYSRRAKAIAWGLDAVRVTDEDLDEIVYELYNKVAAFMRVYDKRVEESR